MKGATALSTSERKLMFDAVYYQVRDIEKSVAFYRDILGFHLTSRDHVARFDLAGVLFELVPNPPDNALPGTGNARLSLGVTDIRQATRELSARGVATTPVKEEPGGLLSYFKDPDGNELCIWQYVERGTSQRLMGAVSCEKNGIGCRCPQSACSLPDLRFICFTLFSSNRAEPSKLP